MIRLTKNKIIYATHWYKPNCDKYVEKEVDKLSPYFNEVVELDDNFTFADLFDYIEREKDLFNAVFSSHLGHHPLQAFIDEIRKPMPEGGERSKIDYVELRRYGERFDGEVEIWVDVCGVNEKTGDGYGIEFSPLNEMKYIPLRLNKTFKVSELKIPSKFIRFLITLGKKFGIPLKRWESPFDYVYVSGTTCFTVYELISEVLNEISFAGVPEKRDETWNGVKEDIKEMISELKQATGDKCAELDDLEKELEEGRNESI
jgi:hypothetical protein